jgi:L-fuculose-phosphate aldolase
LSEVAEMITYIGKLMFDKGLTDIAGGNISCREGDNIYITPTGAGQKWHWNLQPADILCAPVHSDDLLEHPGHSKESISHLAVYRAFPEVNGIIHSHPFHVLPFCAVEKPIQAVILSAKVYGDEFGFIDDAPLYSKEQADKIVVWFQEKKPPFKKFAGVVLLPKHGIYIAAGSLYQAIDCLERMNTNAYCSLAQHILLGGAPR